MKPKMNPKKRHRPHPVPPWATENPDEFDRRLLLWNNRAFRDWVDEAVDRVRLPIRQYCPPADSTGNIAGVFHRVPSDRTDGAGERRFHAYRRPGPPRVLGRQLAGE